MSLWCTLKSYRGVQKQNKKRNKKKKEAKFDMQHSSWILFLHLHCSILFITFTSFFFMTEKRRKACQRVECVPSLSSHGLLVLKTRATGFNGFSGVRLRPRCLCVKPQAVEKFQPVTCEEVCSCRVCPVDTLGLINTIPVTIFKLSLRNGIHVVTVRD